MSDNTLCPVIPCITLGNIIPRWKQAAKLGFFDTGPDGNLPEKSINLAKSTPIFHWPDQNVTGICPRASAKFAACGNYISNSENVFSFRNKTL